MRVCACVSDYIHTQFVKSCLFTYSQPRGNSKNNYCERP